MILVFAIAFGLAAEFVRDRLKGETYLPTMDYSFRWQPYRKSSISSSSHMRKGPRPVEPVSSDSAQSYHKIYVWVSRRETRTGLG